MIMKRTVTAVTDGDTFEVTPDWEWNENKGNRVRPTGVTAPDRGEPGYQKAKEHLASILDGQEVELSPIKMSYDRLLCDVKVGDDNLIDLI